MKNGNRTRSLLLVRVVLVFLLVCVLADEVSAQAVSFVARRDFVVGESPLSVAIGDFNRDRIQDLAIVVRNNVAVLLGLGDGTFKEAVHFPVEPLPTSIAVGDFDRDGNQDLALAHFTRCSILLGNGDGTFQAAHSFSVPNLFDSGTIAIGDFNGDRVEDLAIASTILSFPVLHPSNAIILLGNGDGTFQEARAFSTGVSSQSLAIGDFNGDGKQDLAVTNDLPNEVVILLGNGDGNFQLTQSCGTGRSPSSVAVGDFNGDGAQDLAVSNRGSNDVSILLGNGDGSFQPARAFESQESPNFVAIGDLNRDGVQDLVVTNRDSDSISILVGNGDGTFQPAQNSETGRRPWSVAIGNFNRDGIQDLAVTNSDAGSVSSLLGKEPVIIFRDRVSFNAALDTDSLVVKTVEGWDTYPPSTVLPNGSTVNGITYHVSTGEALVVNTGISLSPPNNLFQTAMFGFQPLVDTFTFVFDEPINAFGITFSSTFATEDGDYLLTTDLGDVIPSFFDPLFPGFPLGQFAGFISATPLRSVTVSSTANALYGMDDLIFAVGAPFAKVNSLVNFQPRTSTFRTAIDPAACLDFAGAFHFDATLTSKSSSPALSGLLVQVTSLTNGNLLQNAEGGPRGAGAILAVPRRDGFSDGVLSPHESVDVPFVICLKNTEPFTFLVDVLGTKSGNLNNSLSRR